MSTPGAPGNRPSRGEVTFGLGGYLLAALGGAGIALGGIAQRGLRDPMDLFLIPAALAFAGAMASGCAALKAFGGRAAAGRRAPLMAWLSGLAASLLLTRAGLLGLSAPDERMAAGLLERIAAAEEEYRARGLSEDPSRPYAPTLGALADEGLLPREMAGGTLRRWRLALTIDPDPRIGFTVRAEAPPPASWLEAWLAGPDGRPDLSMGRSGPVTATYRHPRG